MSTANRKWKPGQKAKFRKTMKAKKAAKLHAAKVIEAKTQPKPTKASEYITDAVSFLRQAQTWINASLTDGTLKKQDESHLLMQIALRRLEGS